MKWYFLNMHCSLLETTLLEKKKKKSGNSRSLTQNHNLHASKQSTFMRYVACSTLTRDLWCVEFWSSTKPNVRSYEIPLTDTKPTYLTSVCFFLGLQESRTNNQRLCKQQEEFTDTMSFFNDHNANKDISISSEVPGQVKVRGCNSCFLRVSEWKSWQVSRLRFAGSEGEGFWGCSDSIWELMQLGQRWKKKKRYKFNKDEQSFCTHCTTIFQNCTFRSHSLVNGISIWPQMFITFFQNPTPLMPIEEEEGHISKA